MPKALRSSGEDTFLAKGCSNLASIAGLLLLLWPPWGPWCSVQLRSPLPEAGFPHGGVPSLKLLIWGACLALSGCCLCSAHCSAGAEGGRGPSLGCTHSCGASCSPG